MHKKSDQKAIYREAQVLRRLKHPNILRCFQFHKLKSSVQIVLEYCPGGSLADLIYRYKVNRKLGATFRPLWVGLHFPVLENEILKEAKNP